MPYKNKEKQLQCQRNHYKNNKKYYFKKNIRRRNLIRKYIRGRKDLPCSDCKIKYPYYVMDFDHIKGKKYIEIASMIRNGFSMNKINQEIRKCELVCSNCHRIRTYKRNHSRVV